MRPSHTVLELGARHGTTSCRLARATNNTGNVVSVDPDASTTQSLLRNRDRHSCNFHVISGTVSSSALHVGPTKGTYNQRFVKVPAGSKQHRSANFDFRQVEMRIGSQFNAALIDCEGCIEHVLSIPGLLAQVCGVALQATGPQWLPHSSPLCQAHTQAHTPQPSTDADHARHITRDTSMALLASRAWPA